MIVYLNGKEKNLQDNSTLSTIVNELNDSLPKFFVVELNGQIIYKEDYDTTILKDKDNLEVVVFAGGG